MKRSKLTAQIAAPADENFNFGDTRINKRSNKMLNHLSQHSGQTLPQAFHDRSEYEAALRFFDNDLVNPEKILRPHFAATVSRCKGVDLIAVLQDSSDLDYDYLNIEGFEPMSPNVDNGFRIHPSLVITEEGTPLGLLGYVGYTRDKNNELPKKHRNCLPIEEKESNRWLKGFHHAKDLAAELGPDSTVVSISDREGDIYEIFSEAEDAESTNSAHVLVRSNHNRMLDNETDDNQKKIEKKLNRLNVIDQGKLWVNQGRSNEREAMVNIRACSILIKAPNTAKKKTLPSIRVNAVLVSEIDPPEVKGKGRDERKKERQKGNKTLYWVLLTTLPIDSVEDIRRIVKFYSKRWQIEVYFKVMKSGCGIDRTRLRTRGRIENFIAFSLLVAWRVMLMTYLSRELPESPCTIAFTDMEWKLAYLSVNKKAVSLPNKEPTIAEIIQLVAELGGYKKRKKPPGIITIWRGISRLFDISHGYDLAVKMLSAK